MRPLPQPTPAPDPSGEDLARDAASDLALCDAATPGPWGWCGLDAPGCDADVYTHAYAAGASPDYSIANARSLAGKRSAGLKVPDAKMIALARTALPAWIRRAAWCERRENYLVAILREIGAAASAECPDIAKIRELCELALEDHG